MVVIQGWFCKPKRDEKKPLYKLMDVFLTQEFVLTHRRLEVQDLVLTRETKFVGNLLTMQEVWQVINLRDEFNPFYVTKDVREALAKMIATLPRRAYA